MVYRNLRQAPLQEVGLTKIPGDHDFLILFPTGQNLGAIAGQIPK
jgi:hypothetical protein